MNFILDFLNSLTTNQIIADIIVVVLIIIEITSRILKNKIKAKYKNRKVKIEEFEEVEKLSITYYRQYQWIDIFRLFSFLIGFILIIAILNIEAWSVLAIAAGAFILTLREMILSFISFFYILTLYKTGDDIQIENALGEIIRVNPLYVAVAGKDEDGEYNGKLHRIPNFLFIGKNVELQDLKTDDYRRIVLKTVYLNEIFEDSFSVWLSKVKNHLEEKLPKRELDRVGNYKGYTGIKYKLNFDYGDKGEIICKISFVARYPYQIEFKENIIEFIESLKKNKKDN